MSHSYPNFAVLYIFLAYYLTYIKKVCYNIYVNFILKLSTYYVDRISKENKIMKCLLMCLIGIFALEFISIPIIALTISKKSKQKITDNTNCQSLFLVKMFAMLFICEIIGICLVILFLKIGGVF